ncbi:MAG: TetR/AcrR family transcriptional regulator [Pseudomonadota bacterium]
MPRLSNAREQIIDRARSLLTERGFEGFSYRDISGHLGIKNAAVHYHFPSKADLGLALVEDFAAEMEEQMRQARATLAPREQLEGYFAYETHYGSSLRLCPVSTLTTSWEGLSTEVRDALSRFWQGVVKFLTDVLEEGRESGEFRFVGEAADKAQLLVAAMSGARQQSRLEGQNLVEKIAGQFRHELYRSRSDQPAAGADT